MSTPDYVPQFIWRVSKFDDLIGRGGLAVSGRWHDRPQSIVYCAFEPTTAYSEVVKGFGGAAMPPSMLALKISVPTGASFEAVSLSDLPENWSTKDVGPQICRPIGDEWLKSMKSSMLYVPSAVVSGKWNVLINASHPNGREFEVVERLRVPFPKFVTGEAE